MEGLEDPFMMCIDQTNRVEKDVIIQLEEEELQSTQPSLEDI